MAPHAHVRSLPPTGGAHALLGRPGEGMMDFGLTTYGLSFAAGLTLSFTAVGVFVASLGTVLGIDPSLLRDVAAVVLLGFGTLLLSARLQERFALATSGMSGAGHGLLSRVTLDGLSGQFVLGLLLGLVWSHCVGPTLGAAVTLASQGEGLAQVGLIMALFGLGAGLPLMLLLGMAILTGGDKLFEAWVLRSAPEWLVALTTSI